MPATIRPHRATYRLLRPDGSEGGVEDLVVAAAVDGGVLVRSWIDAGFPEALSATVDWQLDADLVTRLLHITSRDRWGDEYDLELTVTGNGLLAHRAAPDGPTQVELGWGPAAELDYISAAFPAVMAARARLEVGAATRVDAVQVGTEDLEPRIVPMELALEDAAATVEQPGAGPTQCRRHRLGIPATGHSASFWTGAGGALLAYEGLLRLVSLESP